MNRPSFVPLSLSLCIIVACSAGVRVPSTLPEIGQRMPCQVSKTNIYMISSAQLSPGCEVKVGGITFFFASNDRNRIVYLSTEDPSFSTPEGIRVGSVLTDVLSSGGGEVLAEGGYAYYCRLPSGWYAQFPGIPGVLGEPPVNTSKVQVLFKKR
jgi:hypothetical protein